MSRIVAVAALAALLSTGIAAWVQTADEWIALGARVDGAYGAFIPVGIKIGLDALDRLKAKPRELSVLYYDNDKAPCACFADGIAIATQASVGQRSLTIASDEAPEGAAAVVVIRRRQGGPGFKYTIPMSSLPRLVKMNGELDARGRHETVMKADGLFEVPPAY